MPDKYNKESGVFHRRTDDGKYRKRFPAGDKDDQCGSGTAGRASDRAEKETEDVHRSETCGCMLLSVFNVYRPLSENRLGHPIEPHLFMRAATCKDIQEPNIFLNTFFCCSCGLCELYSCLGLSPRTLMAEYKADFAQTVSNLRVEAAPVGEEREYRKVPMERLMSRLDLTKYNKEAPLDESEVPVRKVKILLSQHIGAPASAIIKVGDKVSRGQMIAEPAKGLSVGIRIH